MSALERSAQNLYRLVDLANAKLAEAEAETGPYNADDYAGWRARRDAAMIKLMQFFADQESAAWKHTGAHDHSVRMAGIRSTSTSGYDGALRNWRATAMRRARFLEGQVPA